MLESPQVEKDKAWHVEDIQVFNLEYMYVVLQRGMQYWLIDYTKSTYRTTEVRYL
jgi:hypothetical protein